MLLATTYELPGGERVRLRLARPTDVPLVREFLEQLWPEEPIGGELVRYFTFYDPRERMVVAATLPSEGFERIVGLADRELVVEDDLDGLASLLSEAVTPQARGLARAA
jgi:hypothetical protein